MLSASIPPASVFSAHDVLHAKFLCRKLFLPTLLTVSSYAIYRSLLLVSHLTDVSYSILLCVVGQVTTPVSKKKVAVVLRKGDEYFFKKQGARYT